MQYQNIFFTEIRRFFQRFIRKFLLNFTFLNSSSWFLQVYLNIFRNFHRNFSKNPQGSYPEVYLEVSPVIPQVPQSLAIFIQTSFEGTFGDHFRHVSGHISEFFFRKILQNLALW